MKKAIVLNTEGVVSTIDLSEGNEYQNLVRIVGGYIQAVPLSDEITIWLNEEGKLENLPLNPSATKIWEHFYGKTDFMVGNAVFTGGTDDEGETLPLSDYAEQLISEIVKNASFSGSMV